MKISPWLLAAWLLVAPAAGAQEAPSTLAPLPSVRAPQITQIVKVRFVTTQGDFVVEVYPQAAPNASKRFLELVDQKFFDWTPVFRVVPNFVAQFGINWRGQFPEWQQKNFNDDPSYFKLSRGTLAFAKAGPNTNSTQLFVNYGDNSRLVQQGGFTAFARVVQGMETVDKFQAVGDPSMGLDQDKLWGEGEKYLKTLRQQPAYILFTEVL